MSEETKGQFRFRFISIDEYKAIKKAKNRRKLKGKQFRVERTIENENVQLKKLIKMFDDAVRPLIQARR